MALLIPLAQPADPDEELAWIEEEQRRIAWRLAELARLEQRETAERLGLFGT